uniref:RAC serine/threonine-protein kinase n=1 Tax=Nannochloropsis gaditana (strain CCMP526) TaxID=1093141 RepID=I2CPC4_NANGC
MKVLNKSNIIKRNQVEHTRTERNVLGYIKHPYIVGLSMAFQTQDKLFFVLDYCAGGELFFHLGKLGKFSEPRSRFYSAEITLALEHVHKLDIVYRDLKPENVLLDARGHVRLTDFGLSKEGISGNTSGAHSFCGTPEYLAPEILNRQGHGRAVDWWSLGALLYEMLTGLPPFYCRDREKLFEKIRNAELTFPKFVSPPARSVLTGLLTRDPALRLGSGPTDAAEVKTHPFFGEIDWEMLLRGALPPPWEPTVCGSLDTSQFDKEFTSMPIFSPAECKAGGPFGYLQHQQGHPHMMQAAPSYPPSQHAQGHISGQRDETFAGFTFTDDSLGLMQAGVQALREGKGGGYSQHR